MKILFLCTGNASRSQMAEGWARHILGSDFEAYSAGVAPTRLDTRAVGVMAEVGVDISSHRSKHVDELKHIDFDLVITVCDYAKEVCPVFPSKAKSLHFGFDDPGTLAWNAKTEEEALSHYRRVRDEIRDLVERIPEVMR